MQTLRRASVAAYIAFLFAGVVAGAWALWVTFASYGQEGLWQTVRRGGAGAGAVAVSILFAGILIVRGFRFIAPLAFLVSYLLVAASLDFSLAGYAKAWAPATSSEASHANQVAVAGEVVVVCFVLVSAWLSGRSRKALVG